LPSCAKEKSKRRKIGKSSLEKIGSCARVEKFLGALLDIPNKGLRLLGI
jgi:hypothetical protein